MTPGWPEVKSQLEPAAGGGEGPEVLRQLLSQVVFRGT